MLSRCCGITWLLLHGLKVFWSSSAPWCTNRAGVCLCYQCPPTSQESRHDQHRQLDGSSGRPTLTFTLTPDNYPRGKILPQMQTYPSSVHGQKSIRVFSPHLVQLRFRSKAIVFVQLRAEFSLCFGMQTDSKLKTHKRTWRD